MAWRVTSEGIIQHLKILPVEEIMFGDYLERLANENSAKLAIFDTGTGQQYTYVELLCVVKSIAATLQDRGVKPNDLVVLCGMTGFKACCYILALALCQATMVATKHFYTVYEFKNVLKNFPSLKLVIADNASASNLRQASSVPVLTLEENWDLSRATDFKHPGKADPKSSVMLMCLTSGSTGPSKAVCMSHYNILANFVQFDMSFANFLMCNPISHMSGVLCFLITVASAEMMFIAPETLRDDVEKYLDVCSKYKVQTCMAMPVLLTSLAKFGPTDKLDSVERFFSGGSTIPQPVIDEFCALHPNAHVEIVFGSSEAGVVLQSNDQSSIKHLAVLPNVEAKIVDLDTNQILGPNENGMFCCKAPSVALGYFNNEKATKEAFVGEWQVTGDLAYRDEEGRIVIVDRLKQMIKCMDSQIAPADLELLLSRDRNVLKVLVAGIPHDKYGEAAVAFVVPRDRSNLATFRKKLLEDVKSKCAFYKHLHGGLYFVESMPETDSGKFSRKVIVDEHLKKQLKYLD